MTAERRTIPWRSGEWTSPPVSADEQSGQLVVEAAAQSDAWLTTAYGFRHASEHALLTDFATDTAIEVAFVCRLAEQFDQAGAFLKVDDSTWIKAGVEFADDGLQLGAVVTHGTSDWSVAPVDDWSGRVVTVRLSRSGNAVTVRARVDDEPFRLVRVAYLAPDAVATAGPFCCAPTRAGLTVRFVSWGSGPADASLH